MCLFTHIFVEKSTSMWVFFKKLHPLFALFGAFFPRFAMGLAAFIRHPAQITGFCACILKHDAFTTVIIIIKRLDIVCVFIRGVCEPLLTHAAIPIFHAERKPFTFKFRMQDNGVNAKTHRLIFAETLTKNLFMPVNIGKFLTKHVTGFGLIRLSQEMDSSESEFRNL